MISVVTLSPTVRTNYPSFRNSSPHNCCFTLGNARRISLELIDVNSSPLGQPNTSEEMRGKGGHDPCQSPAHRFQIHDASPSPKIFLGCDLGWLHQAPIFDTWAPIPDDIFIVNAVARTFQPHASTLQEFCCLRQHAFFIPASQAGHSNAISGKEGSHVASRSRIER